MVKSMTGYGKSQSRQHNKNILIEIRSLNSKNLDVILRLPNIYKEKEAAFRNKVAESFIRGKVEVVVTVEYLDGSTDYSLNKTLFKKYYSELKNLSDELNTDNNHSKLFTSVLGLPDILISETGEISSQELDILEDILQVALEITNQYRLSEGRHMEKDLNLRINNISKLLKQIEPFEKQRIESLKQKLLNNLSTLQMEYDANRFEQEIIYYLEKLDINEEKVRLTKHIEHFTDTLNTAEPSIGKKLGFIAQEIGREINTIGSKASDADIQKIVVEMKDELEKIREQLFNIL